MILILIVLLSWTSIAYPVSISGLSRNENDKIKARDFVIWLKEYLRDSKIQMEQLKSEAKKLSDENTSLKREIGDLRSQDEQQFKNILNRFDGVITEMKQSKDKTSSEINGLKSLTKKLADQISSIDQNQKAQVIADEQQFKNILNRFDGVITEMKQSKDKTSSEINGLKSLTKKLADQISSIDQNQKALIQADKSKSEATFQFKIENFCELSGPGFLSPPTYVRNLPWKIGARPKWQESTKYLALYLYCYGEESYESSNWSVKANFEFRLLSQKEGVESVKYEQTGRVFDKSNGWGWPSFHQWNNICDPRKGYIKDDTVIVEAYFKADAPVIG